MINENGRHLLAGDQCIQNGESAEPTPYLAVDLEVVMASYERIHRSMPDVKLFYAMKCNPSEAILNALNMLGCGFEIASLSELRLLEKIGVSPESVLFSNPVKAPNDIAEAAGSGVYRFAFDSDEEIRKIAKVTPGAAVYVRLAVPLLTSGVPSEGKFGVHGDKAVDLIQSAVNSGLIPYGIAFHVGSQMTNPRAWAMAIEASAYVMRELESNNIRIETLNIGGGFPAQYEGDIPAIDAIANAIAHSSKSLPYQVQILAEPGRSLVAEAGTFVSSVIGTAERQGKRWVHLDVGAFNGMMESLESNNKLRYPMSDSLASERRCLYNVTGPTCDSQDTILFDVELSEGLSCGDIVYIGTAGAYTTVMRQRLMASAFRRLNLFQQELNC